MRAPRGGLLAGAVVAETAHARAAALTTERAADRATALASSFEAAQAPIALGSWTAVEQRAGQTFAEHVVAADLSQRTKAQLEQARHYLDAYAAAYRANGGVSVTEGDLASVTRASARLNEQLAKYSEPPDPTSVEALVLLAELQPPEHVYYVDRDERNPWATLFDLDAPGLERLVPFERTSLDSVGALAIHAKQWEALYGASAESQPLVVHVRGHAAPDAVRGMVLEAQGRPEIQALRAIAETPLERIKIINLLPTDAVETNAWRLSDVRAEEFVIAGRRIHGILGELHASMIAPRGPPEEVAVIIERETADASVVLVIGEAHPGGLGVRVPGQEAGLSESHLRLPAGSTVVGLFCNSRRALRKHPGISVSGEIMMSESEIILRSVLDREPPATLGEYAKIEAALGSTADANAAEAGTGGLRMMAELSGALAGLGGRRNLGGDYQRVAFWTQLSFLAAAGVAVIADDSAPDAGVSPHDMSSDASREPAPPAAAVQPEPTPPAQLPAFALGLVGVVGGLCREFFRWKRLVQAGRAQRYRRGRFFLISGVELLLGGIVAIVIGGALPTSLGLVAAFVAGAGLEEIVRRAVRLKLRLSDVAQGASETTPAASALYYLSQ